MEEDLRFTPEESRVIKQFLETTAGSKLLKTLDKNVEERNNLSQIINSFKPDVPLDLIGKECSLKATEARTYMKIRELLTDIGDSYADSL